MKHLYDLDNYNREEATYDQYLIKALHPMQVSCFLANLIMPLLEGVEMEIDRV